MPKLKSNEVPSYRLHKQSGQAIVTLSGKDLLLGRHNTPQSRAEYDRVIAEWIANGRQLPSGRTGLTIDALVLAFWKHAVLYYRKPDGSQTSELITFKQALRLLRRLYGHTRACDFGPLSLKTLRETMLRPRTAIDRVSGAEKVIPGWCRSYTNKQVSRIRSVFRWACENGQVDSSVYHGLQAVKGLQKGRSEARESAPVSPVAEEHIRAVQRFVSSQVRAMIELQLLTGMRPGEVVCMRGIDIDMSGQRCWVYRPPEHKTQHHGHDRSIYLGPRAQTIVNSFLKSDPAAFLFSPAEAQIVRLEKLHAQRTTPLSCGNRPGTNRRRQPVRYPGARYTVDSYRRAIRRACDRADEWIKGGRVVGTDERVVPRWHPHQIRHTAGTRLRREYGLEAAQVILGHKTLTVTQVYAEKNIEAAQQIMEQAG